MNEFLSCDWGTSSFRISLADPAGFKIIATENSDQGNLKTFNAWKDAGADEKTRVFFYLEVIDQHIHKMEKSIGKSLNEVPVVISGMASSTVGLEPLPYRYLPFATDGSDVGAKLFPASRNFNHDLLLISGVQSEDDVMRGEETQLIGCIPGLLEPNQQHIFIFPGTHSKHISVENGFATAFKTFMTGEFFDLLSTKSILAAGIQKRSDASSMADWSGFEAGVKDSAGANLLHASFRARVNSLFGKLSAEQNFDYLSGLLIGYELQDLVATASKHIYLCCGNHLKDYYEKALEVMGLTFTESFNSAFVQASAIRGQYLVYDKYQQHA